MHITVAITLDDRRVVSGRTDIDSLNQGYVSLAAALVAEQVAAQAVEVLAEGE